MTSADPGVFTLRVGGTLTMTLVGITALVPSLDCTIPCPGVGKAIVALAVPMVPVPPGPLAVFNHRASTSSVTLHGPGVGGADVVSNNHAVTYHESCYTSRSYVTRGTGVPIGLHTTGPVPGVG